MFLAIIFIFQFAADFIFARFIINSLNDLEIKYEKKQVRKVAGTFLMHITLFFACLYLLIFFRQGISAITWADFMHFMNELQTIEVKRRIKD